MSGSLDRAAPTEILLAAVARFVRGEIDFDEVLAALHAAPLLVERTSAESHQVLSVRYQGMPWLPAFATVEHLAAWKQLCGQGSRPVHTGELTGHQLLHECLPQLEPGTGVILNPGSDLSLALPPVAGIVGPELAVDYENLLKAEGVR